MNVIYAVASHYNLIFFIYSYNIYIYTFQGYLFLIIIENTNVLKVMWVDKPHADVSVIRFKLRFFLHIT